MLDLHERYCVKQGQGLKGSEAPHMKAPLSSLGWKYFK